MYLTYRKKVLGCLVVLVVCLWVIYQSSQLALQYDKLLGSLQWEIDRCVHKQGLDPQGRLGPPELFSHHILSIYPESLYSVSPAVLHHSSRLFLSRTPPAQRDKVSQQFSSLLWPVSLTSDPWPKCTRYYDEAYVFSVGMANKGWYHELHTSTLLPLYSLLLYREHHGPHSPHGTSIVLMPTVLNQQGVDWSIDLFGEEGQFGLFQGVLRVFAGEKKLLPLTATALHSGDITCFTTVHFGVGSVNHSDPSLLAGFAGMVLSHLSLLLTTPTQPYLCLVKRTLTRRILNDQELIEAVSGEVKVQVVEFEGLSYREQVSQMQQYTILVGFHGDELLNALYMPMGSVTVQLLPFGANNLQPSKYSELLRAHGPYLEWTNPFENHSKIGGHGDELAGTRVDVGEFITLINKALNLGINRRIRT